MNLSQEEIEAMMRGMNAESSSDGEKSDTETDEVLGGIEFNTEDNPPRPTPTSEELREAAMRGMGEMILDSDFNREDWQISDEECDILGEVGNMCMGAVATTMYTLLDRRVSITTPRVSVHTTREVLSVYQTPFVIVEVEYTEGIDGKNLLLLKEPDAALITDLLMGGDGHVEEPIVLNELHMSAISEIMNQMIGASATTLSKIVHLPVNISTPISDRVESDADVSQMLDYSAVVIKISFDMEIEGLLNSQLLQLIPYESGKGMAKTLMEALSGESSGSGQEEPSSPSPEAAPQSMPQQSPQPPQTPPQPGSPYPAQPGQYPPPYPAQSGQYPPPSPTQPGQYPPPDPSQPYAQPYYGQPAPPPGQPYYGQPAPQYYGQQPPQYYGYPPQSPYPAAPHPGEIIDVRPMQYESFDQGPSLPPASGMGLIHDIPLQVSVELGKTKKDISEILGFGMGTVIVLEKIAGDPVEILANGKLIARGEVVVIDENYGVRITEILN